MGWGDAKEHCREGEGETGVVRNSIEEGVMNQIQKGEKGWGQETRKGRSNCMRWNSIMNRRRREEESMPPSEGETKTKKGLKTSNGRSWKN